MPDGADLRHEEITDTEKNTAKRYHQPGAESIGKCAHDDAQQAAENRGKRVRTRDHGPGPPEIFQERIEKYAEDDIQTPGDYHDDKGGSDYEIAIVKSRWCPRGLVSFSTGHAKAFPN